MRRFLIILSLFIGVGAVGGAIMMWVDPSGNGWGFVAISNIYFALGLIEAAAAFYCLRSQR